MLRMAFFGDNAAAGQFTRPARPRTILAPSACDPDAMRIIHDALTFDDVLLQPAYSEVIPREVSLGTRITREIVLNIPLVSAAMDTVTESRLAIALAQEGGIGIIHKNMSPRDQARQVAAVKKFESGIVNDPNDWGKEHGDPRYIVDLVKRITRVSIETVAIVNALPRLDILDELDRLKKKPTTPQSGVAFR